MNVESCWKRSLLACAVLFTASSAAADSPVRIATIPIDAGAEVFYAQQMGFFADDGLAAAIASYTSGGAIIAGVVSGSIDVGLANVTSLAIAHAHHLPLTIIAPASVYVSSAPTSVCMVARDSPIRTGADLSGKVFATSTLRSSGEMAARAWIDSTGGDAKAVKFVELPQSEMASALEHGRVDAAQVDEPHVAAARKTARIVANCFDAVAPRFLNAAYFTSEAWAREHPQLVRAFAAAIRTTAVWANANRARTATMYAKAANVDVAAVATMVRATYPESLDPREAQPLIDASARYGALPDAFPATELFDPDVLR